MRIIAYNILKGGHGRESQLIEVLRHHQPDVVVFEEATSQAVIETIAKALNFPFVAAKDEFSVAAISQTPFQHQWHDTPHARSPFLEITPDGSEWRIIGLHLAAVFANFRERRRVQQIQELLSIVASYQAQPHILIGDFNAAAPNDPLDVDAMPWWLQLMITLNGGVKRDALASLISNGYVDVFRHCHPDDNGYTLPTPHPNSRLDYAFIPSSDVDRVQMCEVIREPQAVNGASDHFPIVVDLV